MTIKGSLGSYSLIETDDGSQSIYSEYFDENCHSTSGAYSETIYNYIEGCEIVEKLSQCSNLVVLEVGLGAAIGPECLIDTLIKENLASSKSITFYSTEIDYDFTLWVLENSNFAKKYQSKFENYTLNPDQITFTLFNVNFVILIGDARKTIKSVPVNCVDCIFQDAFSPKKNPLLWTVEWFQDLRLIANDTCILSTYSSSNGIRASLLSGGFVIESRKGFGRKRTCTRGFSQEYKKLEYMKVDLNHALTDENYREKLSI